MDRRIRATVTGRGRPAWLYAAVDDSEVDVRLRGYVGLVMALAEHLRAAHTDPEVEAVEIGRRWGRDLATGAVRSKDPREQVLALLADLGFAPSQAIGTAVPLRRCPLLDAARRYPDVVCRVHLGMVRGALEACGGESIHSDLIPFAEPGLCRLEFAAEPPAP